MQADAAKKFTEVYVLVNGSFNKIFQGLPRRHRHSSAGRYFVRGGMPACGGVLGAPGSGRKQQAYFAPPAAICGAGTCKKPGLKTAAFRKAKLICRRRSCSPAITRLNAGIFEENTSGGIKKLHHTGRSRRRNFCFAAD